MPAVPAIEAAALRDLMRQVTTEFPGAPVPALKIGDVMGGKVTMSPEGNRMLMIAGVQVEATLPSDVVIGQVMKLQVAEAGGDRLVLKIVRDVGTPPPGDSTQTSQVATNQTQPTNPTTAPPYAAIPMPGGANARVWLDPDVDADAAQQVDKIRARSMVVRYDSPELGRVDVVLRLDADKLEATVLAPAGDPIARLRSSVPELRSALQAATDVPVQLSTGGRADEAIDVRV